MHKNTLPEVVRQYAAVFDVVLMVAWDYFCLFTDFGAPACETTFP